MPAQHNERALFRQRPSPATSRHAGGMDGEWIDGDATVERIDLDETSWVGVVRGWGPRQREVFDHLLATVPWATSQLFRYDHFVEERRLGAAWQPGTPLPHPALADATRTLQHRYRARFDGFGLV